MEGPKGVKDGGLAALREKMFLSTSVISALERGFLIGRGEEVGGDDEMAEETRIQDELRLKGGKPGEVGGVRGAGDVGGA